MTDKLLHGSPLRLDAFTLEHAGRCGNATNGAMGLWVTTEVWIAERFSQGDGGFIYEVLPSPGRVMDLTVRKLQNLHTEADNLEDEAGIGAALSFYDDIRRRLIAEGYSQVHIIERDGSAPTRIILDPENAKIIDIREVSLNAEDTIGCRI